MRYLLSENAAFLDDGVLVPAAGQAAFNSVFEVFAACTSRRGEDLLPSTCCY